MKNLDVIIRAAVRDWLKLLKDTPLGFFYAKVSDGGLGLSCLAVDVPAQKVKRLMSLGCTEDPAIKSLFGTDYVQRHLRKWDGMLCCPRKLADGMVNPKILLAERFTGGTNSMNPVTARA